MKAVIKLLSIFLVSIILSVFIGSDKLDHIVEEIVYSASSVMVGLAIAVIGIFLGNINSIYLNLIEMFNNVSEINRDERERVFDKISRVKKELMHNIKFCFISFVIIIVLMFWKGANVPYLIWPISLSFFSKSLFINICIVSLNFSIILAVYDTVMGAFQLSNALELTNGSDGANSQ